LCLAQDDVKRFVSEPQPPPSGIEIPVEGKVKERREVGEGDDTVIVEDTSDDDDEDEEILQDRFQLRSRFSRPGLPHAPPREVHTTASGIKYTYSGGPMAPSSTDSGFGTTPSFTKGSIKLCLAAHRAARSLRMASRREGSFENSMKKHLAASFRS
jgi:hypothetical protein